MVIQLDFFSQEGYVMNTVPAMWSCLHQRRIVQGHGFENLLVDISVFSIALHFCYVLLNDWPCERVKTLAVMTIVSYTAVYRNVWWLFFVSWSVIVTDDKGQHNIKIERTWKLSVLLEFLSESSFSEFEWRSFDVWMSSLLREGWSDKVQKLFLPQMKTMLTTNLPGVC